MKKKKSSLKLLKVKVANLNEISNLLGGTNNGDPDPTTKGKPKSKDDAACASRVIILSLCTDGNNTTGSPQTDPQ